MSEGSRGPERPKFPPIEAHPEPPLSKGPLLNQLHELADMQRPSTRRTLLKGAVGLGVTAISIKKVNEELHRPSSAHEEEVLPEIDSGPAVQFAHRNEDKSYDFGNVAEYVDLESFEYRETLDNRGVSTGSEAPIIHEYNPAKFDPLKGFKDEPERSIDKQTKLPPNVKLVRLAIDAESGASNRIMTDPENDPTAGIDIWLGFAIENPNDPTHPIWTDEHGNALDNGTVDVVSPIFAITSDPKDR